MEMIQAFRGLRDSGYSCDGVAIEALETVPQMALASTQMQVDCDVEQIASFTEAKTVQ